MYEMYEIHEIFPIFLKRLDLQARNPNCIAMVNIRQMDVNATATAGRMPAVNKEETN
jgi:hypothetical protein